MKYDSWNRATKGKYHRKLISNLTYNFNMIQINMLIKKKIVSTILWMHSLGDMFNTAIFYFIYNIMMQLQKYKLQALWQLCYWLMGRNRSEISNSHPSPPLKNQFVLTLVSTAVNLLNTYFSCLVYSLNNTTKVSLSLDSIFKHESLVFQVKAGELAHHVFVTYIILSPQGKTITIHLRFYTHKMWKCCNIMNQGLHTIYDELKYIQTEHKVIYQKVVKVRFFLTLFNIYITEGCVIYKAWENIHIPTFQMIFIHYPQMREMILLLLHDIPNS